MPEEALTSFTVSDAVCGSGIVIEVRYIMSTNNVIVLDLCFNLTDKSNLIDRL